MFFLSRTEQSWRNSSPTVPHRYIKSQNLKVNFRLPPKSIKNHNLNSQLFPSSTQSDACLFPYLMIILSFDTHN